MENKIKIKNALISVFDKQGLEKIIKLLSNSLKLMAGLDSYLGVLIASLTIGVLEAMAQWKLGGDWAEITPYVIVLIVILIRPHGIMGQKEVERI